jgi:hypothetical protein
VRPQPLELVAEDPVAAELRLDAHRGSDVGDADEDVEVGEREQQHPEHPVGAVDEREALLLGEGHRSDTGVGERLGGGSAGPGRVVDLALAHQRERDGRQGCEVTGAPEAAVLVDDGGDAGVDELGQRLGDEGTDPGPPGGERPQPEEHHRADDLTLDRRAGPGGVRADQRPLELRAQLLRDVTVGERAEAGGDAVDRGGPVSEFLDVTSSGLERLVRVRAQGDGRAVACDRDDVGR